MGRDFSEMLNQNHSGIVINSNNEKVYDESLDRIFATEEVFYVLKSSKNGKSAGVNDIQVELFKNPTALNALTHILKLCFDSSKCPAMWSKGVTTHFPKSSTARCYIEE